MVTLKVLKIYFIYFIFGCSGLCCHTQAFSNWGEQGLLSSCGSWASHSGGFSCKAWALGHGGFSSCGTWAQQLWFPGSRAQAQRHDSCGARA